MDSSNSLIIYTFYTRDQKNYGREDAKKNNYKENAPTKNWSGEVRRGCPPPPARSTINVKCASEYYSWKSKKLQRENAKKTHKKHLTTSHTWSGEARMGCPLNPEERPPDSQRESRWGVVRETKKIITKKTRQRKNDRGRCGGGVPLRPLVKQWMSNERLNSWKSKKLQRENAKKTRKKHLTTSHMWSEEARRGCPPPPAEPRRAPPGKPPVASREAPKRISLGGLTRNPPNSRRDWGRRIQDPPQGISLEAPRRAPRRKAPRRDLQWAFLDLRRIASEIHTAKSCQRQGGWCTARQPKVLHKTIFSICTDHAGYIRTTPLPTYWSPDICAAPNAWQSQ